MSPQPARQFQSGLRRTWIFAFLALLLAASVLPAQKKKDDQATTRNVQGFVTDADDAPVNGAVVQLKNTKTLEIRSFITQDKGSYYFHGLSPDIDYELRAEYNGMSSGTKTLSSFDSRRDAVLNLKLNKK